MNKAILVRLVLAAVLLCTLMVSGTAPVEAGFAGRHTILGRIFRVTPLGRTVATFEDRRDAYRAANQWLEAQRTQTQRRQQELREALIRGDIDLRTYQNAWAHNQRRLEQYNEVRDRMRQIAAENFNRALAQEAFSRLGPRLARNARFNRNMDEIKETMTTVRDLLQEGSIKIDDLASRAYPDQLRTGRQRVRDLQERLEQSGLRGGPVESLRRGLERIERQLAQWEEEVPERVKPDAVHQLQADMQRAREELVGLQEQLDGALERLDDQNTVYFPERRLRRDPVIREQMQEFARDSGLVRQAIAETERRRAEAEARREFDLRIRAACETAGITAADTLSPAIWRRVANLLPLGQTDSLGDADLASTCAEARDQIEREAVAMPDARTLRARLWSTCEKSLEQCREDRCNPSYSGCRLDCSGCYNMPFTSAFAPEWWDLHPSYAPCAVGAVETYVAGVQGILGRQGARQISYDEGRHEDIDLRNAAHKTIMACREDTCRIVCAEKGMTLKDASRSCQCE